MNRYINLFRVDKDQNEHCAILTSNVIGLTSPKDFKNNTHILNMQYLYHILF